MVKVSSIGETAIYEEGSMKAMKYKLSLIRVVLKKVFFLIFAVPLSSLAQEPRILEQLPFEVTARIQWQGQEISLRKVLSCDLTRRLTATGVRAVWDQHRDKIVHVFPSKEVLIIRVPHVCYESRKEIQALPSNYLPYAYWVDNVESPKVAEKIVWHEYFRTNSKRKLSIESFQIRLSPGAKIEVDESERMAEVFDNGLSQPTSYFVGISAVELPRSAWEKFPEVAGMLATLKETQRIDSAWFKANSRWPGLRRFCESPTQGTSPAPRCLTGPLDDRPYAMAVSLRNDTWRIEQDDVGVWRYFWAIAAKDVDQRGCGAVFVTCNLLKGNYLIEVDSKLLEVPKGVGEFVFDKTRQVLIRLDYAIKRSTNPWEGK